MLQTGKHYCRLPDDFAVINPYLCQLHGSLRPSSDRSFEQTGSLSCSDFRSTDANADDGCDGLNDEEWDPCLLTAVQQLCLL